jgi:GT2 family glycosyltransferase
MIRVSVIVINWNGKPFLNQCISSVLNQSFSDLELLVIDSGSTDGSVDSITREFSGIQVIGLRENLGFCKAFNLGVKTTRGKYVLLLNADTYLEPHFIEMAVERLEKDPAIGFLSGKTLRFDKKTIDSAGQYLGRDRRPVDRGYEEEDRGQYDEDSNTFSVCGAVAFYRRDMLEDCALLGEVFDEDYFAFYEDLDLGWRANLLGWKGVYVPGAIAFHFRWGSSGFRGLKKRYGFLKRPLEVKFHLIKNRYMTMVKNDSLRGILRDLPWILLHEGKLWGSVLLFSPQLLFILPRSIPYLIRAYKKRFIIQRRKRWTK